MIKKKNAFCSFRLPYHERKEIHKYTKMGGVQDYEGWAIKEK